MEKKMFIKEDNTYNELREKSIEQWLNQMNGHNEIAVRGGVKVTRDYIEDLKKEIKRLEDKNALKDKYLKKMKAQLK